MGATTLGIDASASNIAIASLHAAADPGINVVSSALSSLSSSPPSPNGKGKGKLTYEHTSVEELLEQRGPASFDVVCSMEVLEHVDNPRAFLDSCAQLVKVGRFAQDIFFETDMTVYSLAVISSYPLSPGILYPTSSPYSPRSSYSALWSPARTPTRNS